MRTLIFTLFIVCSINAQDSYKTKSGIIYKVGDTINIGQPLSHLGWVSIFTDENQKEDFILNKNLINTDVVVTKIDTSNKFARLFFLYKKKEFFTEIDEALRNKEVIPQFERKLSKDASNKYAVLKQLKELLDIGAITQDEFEAEKKKILNKD